MIFIKKVGAMIRDSKEYKEAIKKLNEWAYAYYVEDNPLVTDEVYDRLYKEVEEFERANPNKIDKNSPTQRVGDTIQKGFKKAKHLSPMWSMEDVFNEDELREWLDRIKKNGFNPNYYIEPKFDGASLNLIYEDGILKQAITRGDGIEGEDVTLNAKAIDSILLEIDYKGLIEIRGEVLMSFREFERINQERIKRGETPFKNPRNAASGSIRQLDTSITAKRKLIFQPWGVGVNSLNSQYLSKKMDFIYSLGFRKPPIRRVVNTLEEIEATYKEINSLRASLEVMLDGMVIKVDEIKIQEALGYTVKYPKWMVAYKFPAIEKQTKLLDVIPQVGRTGVITPVAILEPVEIEGVIVERATLNNYDYIAKLDIQIGDIVTLIRSGDVIPKIISVLKQYRDGSQKPIPKPRQCPVCGSELLIEEILIKCQNLKCPARVVNSIIYFASKGCMNIEGLGKKVAELLYKEGLVKDIEDIYHLKLEQLLKLEGFKEKKALNLLKGIESSKGAECWRFVNALGIEHIGEVASKKICAKFGLNFLDATKEELEQIDGFGKEMADSFLEFIRVNREKIIRLIKIIKPKVLEQKEAKESPFKGKTIVLTGAMSRPRGEVKKILESLGAKVTNSVSKKTDFLIYGKEPGSKYKRAKELGVKIISEDEMSKMIN